MQEALSCNFCRYGRPTEGVTLAKILEDKDSGYFARAENSGCEGTYVEIARWNEKNRRWERYAFCKFLGGELYDDDMKAADIADRVVAEINKDPRESFIHTLPDWEEK